MLVAHRGFREKGVRENRYTDFEWALKVCKAVEFDIRLNGDNEIVIFHDNDFKRIGNNSLKVRKATQKDIDQIFKTKKDWKPTLFKDYIDNLSNKYEWINVEIKPNRYTEQEYQIFKEALLKLRKKTKAEIVVSSFSKNDLKFIATLDKQFKKGYLVERLSDLDSELFKNGKFDYLHPYIGSILNKKNINLLKKWKLKMNVWTYKTQDQIDKSKKIYGDLIFGYISDNPDVKI